MNVKAATTKNAIFQIYFSSVMIVDCVSLIQTTKTLTVSWWKIYLFRIYIRQRANPDDAI